MDSSLAYFDHSSYIKFDLPFTLFENCLKQVGHTSTLVCCQSVTQARQAHRLTPSQHLIQAIVQLKRCSIASLAKELNLPYQSLRKLMLGISRRPRMKVFSKLVCFYCYLLIEHRQKEIIPNKTQANNL